MADNPARLEQRIKELNPQRIILYIGLGNPPDELFNNATNHLEFGSYAGTAYIGLDNGPTIDQCIGAIEAYGKGLRQKTFMYIFDFYKGTPLKTNICIRKVKRLITQARLYFPETVPYDYATSDKFYTRLSELLPVGANLAILTQYADEMTRYPNKHFRLEKEVSYGSYRQLADETGSNTAIESITMIQESKENDVLPISEIKMLNFIKTG